MYAKEQHIDTMLNASYPTGYDVPTLQPDQEAGRISYEYLVPIALLLITTCLLNLAVMLTVRCNRRLMYVINIYVFSLAIVDFIVGSIVCFGWMLHVAWSVWPVDSVLCDMWVFIDFSCTTISTFHICLIARDRYVILTGQPGMTALPMSNQRAIVRSLTAWILGILAWVPIYVHLLLTAGLLDSTSSCLFKPPFTLAIIQCALVYYIPFAVIFSMYTGIINSLLKKPSPTPNSHTDTPVSVLAPSENGEPFLKKYTSTADEDTDGSIGGSRPELTVRFSSHTRRSQDHTGSVIDLTARGAGEQDATGGIVNNHSNGEIGKLTTCGSDGLAVDDLDMVMTVAVVGSSADVQEDYDSSCSTLASFSHTGDVPLRQLTRQQSRRRSQRRVLRRQRSQRRATRAMCTVMAAFLICWVPHSILWPLETYCDCVPVQLYMISYCLTYLNSTITPLLYFTCNCEFREGFVRMIRKFRNGNR